MNEESTNILISHYTDTIKKFGANSRGADWGSNHKHRLRLHNFINRIGLPQLESGYILDVGCGFGELLTVLKDDHKITPSNYCGIDPCEPMITAAISLHPGYKFETSSIENFQSTEPVDHIVCCGIFTKKAGATDESMYKLLNSFLFKALQLKTKTITFNTMSPLCDNRPEDLFFPNLDDIILIIKKYWGYKTKKLLFSNDYLQYELLIHLEI